MSKFIAYSPNGQAYQCDTLAEAKMVQGGGKRRNPIPNYIPTRNPVYSASEDYNMGLFAGAIEHGNLPDPKASAEYRKGYAQGATVARVNPQAVQQALGVFKATGSQAKAGHALRDAALDTGRAVANPKRKRRNPLPAYVTPDMSGDPRFVSVANPSWQDIKAGAAKFGKAAMKHAKAAAKGARSGYKAAREAYAEQADVASAAGAADVGLRRGLKAGYAGYKAHLGKNPKGSRRAFDKTSQAYQQRQAARGFGGYTKMDPCSACGKRRAVEPCIGIDEGGKCPESSKWLGDAICMPCINVERRKAGLHAVDVYGDPLVSKAKRNPMSATARKHLAHEKSEEATFATMLDKLPVGVTLKAGKHRVRKLSKGYVVIDGVRMTDKEAAKKIHRG